MKAQLLLISLLFCVGGLHSQQLGTSVLNTGGGSFAIAGGGTLVQGLGETSILTLPNNNVILTQGLLQVEPDERPMAITPVPPGIFIRLFPNPVQEQVFLETNANFLHSAKVWDLLGREVKFFDLGRNTIQMNGMSEGQYILGLFDTSGGLRYTWRFHKY